MNMSKSLTLLPAECKALLLNNTISIYEFALVSDIVVFVYLLGVI